MNDAANAFPAALVSFAHFPAAGLGAPFAGSRTCLFAPRLFQGFTPAAPFRAAGPVTKTRPLQIDRRRRPS